MRLRYGHLADAVTMGDAQKLSLHGLFDYFVISPEATQFPLPEFFIALAVDCSIAEGSRHTIGFSVRDIDGAMVHAPRFLPDREFHAPVPGAPLRWQGHFMIRGMTLPKEGEYEFVITVDDVELPNVIELRIIEQP